MDINRNIATNIKRYREELGLTQKELADRLQFSNPSTIQKWEVGRNRVYPEYLYELSKIFGCKMEDLYMEKENVLQNYYKGTEDKYAYYMQYPEADYFIGIDDVVKALVDFEKEEYNICDIDKSKDIEDERRRISEWEEENSFFVAVNKETGIIYGMRDYGRYCPGNFDVLFDTECLPVYISLQPPGYPVSLEEMTDQDWETYRHYRKLEIEERSKLVVEQFRKETERYFAELEDGKTSLFIYENMGTGIYAAYDIKNQKKCNIEKFASDPENFYVREEGVQISHNLSDLFPMAKKADGSYKLFFPDIELMENMGYENAPFCFSEIFPREDYQYETVKKFSFKDEEADMLYERVINLLNTYPAIHKTDAEYKQLKETYEKVTERLSRNEKVSDRLMEDLYIDYDTALEIY